MLENTKELKYRPHLRKTDSTFEFTTDQLVHAEMELPLGWHNQVEIIKILEGDGVFNISGRATRVRAGSFVIINPNQIHSAVASIGRPLRFQSLKFTYSYFATSYDHKFQNEYIDALESGESFLPNTIITTFPIHDKITELFDEFSSTLDLKLSGYQIYLRMLMTKMLYIFYSNKFIYHKLSHNNLRLKTSETMVKDTIHFIHSNYFENFSLDLVALDQNTSKPHLCRIFKRMTNTTITEYQNSYRIKKACELLADSENSIQKIAFDIGYNNISYFNKRFKHKTFLTPIEYRQTYKRG